MKTKAIKYIQEQSKEPELELMKFDPTGTLNLVVEETAKNVPSGDSDDEDQHQESPKGSIHFDPFETFSNEVAPQVSKVKNDFDFNAFNDAMDEMHSTKHAEAQVEPIVESAKVDELIPEPPKEPVL